MTLDQLMADLTRLKEQGVSGDSEVTTSEHWEVRGVSIEDGMKYTNPIRSTDRSHYGKRPMFGRPAEYGVPVQLVVVD